jgi:hypothetical protein
MGERKKNLNVIGKSVVFSYDYVSGGEIDGTYMSYTHSCVLTELNCTLYVTSHKGDVTHQDVFQ